MVLGYSTIVIKPVFRIAPEAFNAVDVIPAFGFAFVFAYNDMVAAYRQGSVGLPVISII